MAKQRLKASSMHRLVVHRERFRMKYPLLLWLFLPALLMASDPGRFVNDSLQPFSKSSISEESYSTQNPQDDTTTSTEGDCDDLFWGEHCIIVYLKGEGGLMTKTSTMHISDASFSKEAPDNDAGIGGFLVRNITCILTTELSCIWNALNTPLDAEYTITISQADYPTTICDSDKKHGRVIGCHGSVENHKESFTLNISVSCEKFWYLHYRKYNPKSIVKLRPPQNISASVISGNLIIEWKPPSKIPDNCFQYQLRINKEDEPRYLISERSYTVPSVDLRKTYFVQMRVTKTKYCVYNNIWSDWSAAVEVPASEKLYELKPAVIAAIALGIPMFLLAILLGCRCPSKMEKIFPVPSPSLKIKQLLEKDDFIQVLPAKYIEETTEVLFVGHDEFSKISE